ncbi:MAG: phosphoribosylformylglycinamidine synthase I [Chloroflexi bacterium]|nr:phosphoribosylformylglycinamidine synthase I [Chloroflexota bacterium]
MTQLRQSALSPPIAILHAPGTNRDMDAAIACEWAGGAPEIVHINQLLAGERRLSDYAMLVIPGGFSYGDDLGAGKLWAVRLLHDLGDQLHAFANAGKPILGICNGFQVLVKTGLLPGAIPNLDAGEDGGRLVTLTRNESAHFECRWVHLEPNRANPSPWLHDLERIFCPVAHGEGRFMARDADALEAILAHQLVAFTYVDEAGRPGPYPINPNGSDAHIAGVTNLAGNILGLMPHPENHILPYQHPNHHRGQSGQMGLKLFENGVAYARAL